MSAHVYRLLATLSIFSILLASAATPASATLWRDKVSPWVLQTASQGETEFLVYLTTQVNLSAAGDLATKVEKGEYVYESLVSTAQRTQKGLITQLDSLGVEYRPYWIANMIWVRGSLNTIQAIAARLDVVHLYANPQVNLDEPVAGDLPDSGSTGIEWNLSKVNAPQVWDLGYTGQGVVIGGQDTGYQWDHPAIKNQYRGWDGVNVDHNYNWFDATYNHSQVPVDPYGHGTHTMGTMVGDDGGNNQIGMAPGAHWIGCRNMDAGGNGTPETYSACYQWFIAPTRLDGSDARPDLAPDVINNSWACPPSEGCEPDSLLIPVRNLVAAGIVSAHSAGNSGSGCGTVQYPAAIFDESFTVGATDSSDTIAGFSSRGPVPVDGSNRPKPDLSAPGVNIRSCYPGGPHVAGLVALLISAYPDLRGYVDQIEFTIERSALHIAWTGCSSDGVPNNAYGWGRIDALAAVSTAHQILVSKIASTSLVQPGDLITYTLSITHSVGISPTTNVVLTDTLPVGTTFVSATAPYTQVGDTIQWGFPSLEAMATRSVDLEVRVNITATGSITNTTYAVRSDQVAQVRGKPVTTPIEQSNMLALYKEASAPLVLPGDLITYTLTVTNVHQLDPTSNIVLTDTLPAGTTFVSTTMPYTQIGDTLKWEFPTLDAMTSLNVEMVVQVELAATGSIINSAYAVHSDQAVLLYGTPVVTLVVSRVFLPMLINNP
jgi:serine protease AprX